MTKPDTRALLNKTTMLGRTLQGGGVVGITILKRGSPFRRKGRKTALKSLAPIHPPPPSRGSTRAQWGGARSQARAELQRTVLGRIAAAQGPSSMSHSLYSHPHLAIHCLRLLLTGFPAPLFQQLEMTAVAATCWALPCAKHCAGCFL